MFRHLIIKNSSKISILNNNLILSTEEGKFSVNLEDISSIVLESKNSQISTYALCKLSEYNILLYTCDDKHLINGVLTSMYTHHKSSSILKSQINVKKVVTNNLWKNIIHSKITNQAKCLELLNIEGSSKLNAIATTIKLKDKTNREGYAAKLYFDSLFDLSFNRRDKNAINSALNYGYAIIRGNISRYCAVYGLNTELGIFHDNQLNSYNLVDDLIEPFRPFVDLYVYSVLGDISEFGTLEKQELLKMNTFDLIINEKRYSLDNAISIFVQSYKSSIVENNPELLNVPHLIPLKVHKYE